MYRQRLIDYHAVVNGAKRHLASYTNPEYSLRAMDAMIVAHPDLFPADSRMTEYPVTFYDGAVIEARVLRLQSRFTFDDVLDMTDEIYASLADMLAEEIREQWAKHEADGYIVHPYLPVVSAGIVIDPSTCAPIVTYRSLIGVENSHD